MAGQIPVETREIDVNGHPALVSILHYQELYTTEESVEAGLDAHTRAAAEFLANPISETQKSACIITDATAVSHYLTKEFWEEWFKTAPATHFATQRALYEIFKRPVLLINVFSTLDLNWYKAQVAKTTANSELFFYVNTLEQALETASSLLGLVQEPDKA